MAGKKEDKDKSPTKNYPNKQEKKLTKLEGGISSSITTTKHYH